MFIVTDAISIKFEDMTPCNAIDPSWIVSGEVDEANHVIHTSSDGKFIAQIWECRTPAEVFIDGYPVDEFITVIDGEVELVCDGVSERFGAGDSFILPKGYKGTWRQTDRLRKYAICYFS
tara:strand:+ start:1621 stop:1980 length:360 start_codon:yes stop_codon:yes gene_type:complete